MPASLRRAFVWTLPSFRSDPCRLAAAVSVLAVRLKRGMEEGAHAPFLDLGRRGYALDHDGLVWDELGKSAEQGLDSGQMAGCAAGQRDTFLTVGDKKPAQPGSLC